VWNVMLVANSITYHKQGHRAARTERKFVQYSG